MIKTKPRILCVDDEPSNLKILDAILVSRGYEVLLAKSGEEALELIGKQKVDLILLDVMMPEVSGYDVCKRIKGDVRYQNIPVVMVTALTSKEERIKSIEAGAEDFISKPFDHTELLTRIKMLLKMKDLSDRLSLAYTSINQLTVSGESIIKSFDPLHFDFLESVGKIVNQLIAGQVSGPERPGLVVVGVSDADRRQWFVYEGSGGALRRETFRLDVHRCLALPGNEPVLVFSNRNGLGKSDNQPIIKALESLGRTVINIVSYHSNALCVHALNYGRDVTAHDAAVLNTLVMQTLFLRSLSGQVKDTEHAFDYLVHAMARAAEANDEDTGNHILRVGEYCALVAKELGMSEQFIGIIRIQAMLHDVGKIHVHPDILKKPGKLTAEEYEEIKKHTITGATILGDHVRLTLARKACLSHHERWDGGGYPHGLRGEQIPLEGRILNIADQYDALRNARVYKPAFDHQKTYGIITEGDGRTMPHHFDPQVLKAFKDTASQCEEIYDKLKG